MARPTRGATITRRDDDSSGPKDRVTRGPRLHLRALIERDLCVEGPLMGRVRHSSTRHRQRRGERSPKSNVARRNTRQGAGRVNGQRANARRHRHLNALSLLYRLRHRSNDHARVNAVEGSLSRTNAGRGPMAENCHDSSNSRGRRQDGGRRCVLKTVLVRRCRQRDANTCARYVSEGRVADLESKRVRIIHRVNRGSLSGGFYSTRNGYARNRYGRSFFRALVVLVFLSWIYFRNTGLRGSLRVWVVEKRGLYPFGVC